MIKNRKGLSSNNSSRELKKLRLDVRNKVRTINASDNDNDNGIKVLNSLRVSCSVGELLQIEKTLRLMSEDNSVLPEHFPSEPQTRENFVRLCPLPIDKLLAILNNLVKHNSVTLLKSVKKLKSLNNAVLQKNFISADKLLGSIIECSGYSHLILRKAVLISNLKEENQVLTNTDRLLELAGIGYNNGFVSSLMHCFQEEQDFLNIKRSIMGTDDRGNWNRFTRDMLRISFHPHVKDNEEMSSFIQSNLQSSLFDAIIALKINVRLIDLKEFPFLIKIIENIELSSRTIDQIAGFYMAYDESERIFYQQSGAWLENSDVVRYRLLQDNFFDSPNTSYTNKDELTVKCISEWAIVNNLEDLCTFDIYTKHKFKNLQKLEKSGDITKSSLFNYIIHRTEGKTYISEEHLIDLMGVTSELERTINVEYIKVLAEIVDSDISKIIFYLLIAKRSKNELDSHKLRRLLQKIVVRDHDGDLTKFVSDMAAVSPVISEYSYSVFTEDFLAQLSHVIKSSKEITDTRAKLHQWMGKHTGESTYNDRARSILIDHQINLVKDEIDDNRIYVDTSRFIEWIHDEKLSELSSLFLILDHYNELSNIDDAQLKGIIGKCYFEFCSNKYFGIASYLGRRIRHGTFKGHLYSDVISIESNYDFLKEDGHVSARWKEWKNEHEKRVDEIVRDKLHVESVQKRKGFLVPNIDNQAKGELGKQCMKNLLQEYEKTGNALSAPIIIIDYCWRFAELDLKDMNSYLKSQKQLLMNESVINEIKGNFSHERRDIAKDFSRDLRRQLNDKLTSMYGWFNRPQSVSPKASLGLLYKAVVAEVQQTYREFSPNTDFDELSDIEVVGSAYHVIYDAFYVVVYNAAKHGKVDGDVTRQFMILKFKDTLGIRIKITSEIKDDASEQDINLRLNSGSSVDIENAQLNEDRSGISKLYNLQKYDEHFMIKEIICRNRIVKVEFDYLLEI
jgi:hypothetical protein